MEKLYKGINYTAIGLLFMVLSINIDFGVFRINIIPDWVGFILMFFSLCEFEDDRHKHLLLKIVSIIGALFAIAEWIIEILNNPIDITMFSFVFSLLKLLMIFAVLGIVIRIAKAVKSPYAQKLNVTRTVMLLGLVLTLIAAILTYYLDEMFALAATVAGAVVLICAVITIIMMNGFKKELKNLEAQSE